MATKSYWRPIARKAITDVISANPGLDEKALRKKISLAYPFGRRSEHPYKIWLDEVKKQLEAREKLQDWKNGTAQRDRKKADQVQVHGQGALL